MIVKKKAVQKTSCTALSLLLNFFQDNIFSANEAIASLLGSYNPLSLISMQPTMGYR